MRNYIVEVNGKEWRISAYSAKQAIAKILRSVIGTRTAEKMLPLYIKVERFKPDGTQRSQPSAVVKR